MSQNGSVVIREDRRSVQMVTVRHICKRGCHRDFKASSGADRANAGRANDAHVFDAGRAWHIGRVRAVTRRSCELMRGATTYAGSFGGRTHELFSPVNNFFVFGRLAIWLDLAQREKSEFLKNSGISDRSRSNAHDRTVQRYNKRLSALYTRSLRGSAVAFMTGQAISFMVPRALDLPRKGQIQQAGINTTAI
ncbi:hypothetical protein AWB67_04839 [Caballeronia terrestris]|uniref:Uncharacterized protein n=1 Tax=Caballeronia terrestris TaxID=1226301 RepID=A0A158K4K3_9BURK|nr:hypothetical protein [Caballeronia terrestris]SAL75895.1 hypothetical protein AWB67_04839 [Caballeronia terrestris]